MVFRSPAAPDPARRSKIDTFNKTRTRQHKQPEDHIARTRGHTGPSCNNTKGISKDSTKLEWSSSDWALAGHERSCLLVVLPVIYLACASHLCCCLPDRRPKWLLGGWVGWLRRRRKKKKKNGGGGDADVDDGEDFPNSIYTNSRSTASAAATGSGNNGSE